MFDTFANAFGPTQWIVVLVIVLVLFGGSRIPEMMRGLGTGLKEFKKGMKEDETEETAKKEEKETAKKE